MSGRAGYRYVMSDTTAAGPLPAPEEAQPAPGGAAAGLESLGKIFSFLRHGDIGLALGVVTIMTVLILPMPAVMLDFFLAVSITFSVLILMTALFIHTPLEFDGAVHSHAAGIFRIPYNPADRDDDPSCAQHGVHAPYPDTGA